MGRQLLVFLDFLNEVVAAALGHANVGQDEVRLDLPGKLQRTSCIVGGSHHIAGVFEQAHQPIEIRLDIVHDEYRAFLSGTCTGGLVTERAGTGVVRRKSGLRNASIS